LQFSVFAAAAILAVAAVAAIFGPVGPRYISRSDDVILGLGSAVTLIWLYAGRVIQNVSFNRQYRNVMLTAPGAFVIFVSIACAFGLTPRTLVGSAIGGNSLSLVVALVYFTRHFPIERGQRRLIPILPNSIQVHAVVWGHQLPYRVDLVALGIMQKASVVGLYALATALAEVLWVVAEACSLLSSSDAEASTRAGKATQLVTLLHFYNPVAVVGVVGLAGAGFLLFNVVLPAFHGSLLLLLILLPGTFVGGRARIALNSLLLDANCRSSLLRLAGLSAFMCLAFVPAIVWASARGAAITSTLIYFIQERALYAIARRRVTRRAAL
jgi:hypothetical protein